MKITCLLAFTLLLLLATPIPAQMRSLGAKDTWAGAKLSSQEVQQIIAGAEQSAFDTPDSGETELHVKRVDLGASQGIVAEGTSLLCGGTGNCQIFVFRKADDKWVSLFKADAPIAETFQLDPTATNGVKDLVVISNSSAAKSERSVYKFDGRFYQKTAAHGEPAAPIARTSALFEFHSNFWVNLHQVLFHEALLRAGKPDRRLQSNIPLTDTQMSGQENADWNTAVAFYSANFGSRNELFDEEMVKINDELAKQPDDGANLNAVGLPSEVAAVLQRAAPIYRKYWWAANNKSNEDWISSQSARVRDFGPEIKAAMEKDLRQQWPAAPLRVDVCYYVPQIGHAYTTDGLPPHTTFSAGTPSLRDLSGFEALFHEASHSFADTMANALSAECRAEKKDCGDLWHAVLFYTAGVEVRRALPPADQANFTPYAYKYGLYERGDYPNYRRVLEADWQKYLDGKMDFMPAIHSMATDLQ